VESEDCAGRRVLQHALFDHQPRAAPLPPWRTFLGRLENEFHGAGKIPLHPGQDFGDAHQDGHVVVVAAGVHHPHFLPVELGPDRRFEGQVHLLGHREGIHVGAERHDRPRLAAPQDAHHAGMRHAGADLESEPGQVIRHQLGGPHFAIRQLGMLMDVPAPGDDARQHLRGGGVDPFSPECSGPGGRWGL
jgi:hypothetical protein